MKTSNLFYFVLFAGLLVVLISLPLLSQAGDSIFDEMDREIEESQVDQGPMDADKFYKAQDKMRETLGQNMEDQKEEWGRLSEEMEAQWDEMVKRVNAQREELEKRVERQWDVFQDSNNKEWVDYNDDMDTRSRVDYEKGEIDVETLIPVEELNENPQKKAKELAEEKIKKQIEKVLSADNEVKTEALKDQIKDPKGKVITKKNSEEYVEKYVAPKMKVEEKPVVAKDGVPRLKVKVKIKMVPEHLRVRAEKYKGQVSKYADEYKLDPALVYAVIHTESFFNPMAKSYIPAYGLMQLVPRSGAMDAYYYLYKEKKLLPPDYLYNPDNNVMLGATYLHILLSRYLANVNDHANRQTLSIAAYNWGTGRIQKNIVKKHEVDELSHEEVVRLIDEVAPKETRDYVEKVNDRMKFYRGM